MSGPGIAARLRGKDLTSEEEMATGVSDGVSAWYQQPAICEFSSPVLTPELQVRLQYRERVDDTDQHNPTRALVLTGAQARIPLTLFHRTGHEVDIDCYCETVISRWGTPVVHVSFCPTATVAF